MKTPHKERRLPQRWSNSPPEFSFLEYQYIEAIVYCDSIGHNSRECAGERGFYGGCEMCTSINAMRALIGRHHLQAIMLAIADRLGLKHE